MILLDMALPHQQNYLYSKNMFLWHNPLGMTMGMTVELIVLHAALHPEN